MILPIVLLLVGTMVGGILAIETEIKLEGALDRTAAELSLVSPICELLVEDASFLEKGQSQTGEATREISAALQEIFPGQTFSAILSDVSLDLVSTNILGPIINQRINYWLAECESGQPGWLALLGKRSLFLDWNLKSHQLWLCLDYQLKSPAGWFRRQAKAVVSIWIGSGGSEAGESADTIWLLDNFSRGQEIRQLLGGNLPYDFPVIASFADGAAISIKSMDLTAPTYEEPQAVINEISLQTKTLADFQGAVYVRPEQRIEISAEAITRRKLILVIPGNCSQPWLETVLSDMKRQAAGQSVELETVRLGNSTRYPTGAATPADQD